MSNAGLWCMPLDPSVRASPSMKKQPGTRCRSSLTSSLAGTNAVFDAAGVRLRDIPFTPERVRAALAEMTGEAGS
jgi:hypothetical protein